MGNYLHTCITVNTGEASNPWLVPIPIKGVVVSVVTGNNFMLQILEDVPIALYGRAIMGTIIGIAVGVTNISLNHYHLGGKDAQ